ncbi:hypothetical protein BCR35DRAFT_203871 [Leucosporidium creatinivorum]|uniref:Uncharacterized protein n=1 Tax=Leucosporidium creatinivorum TaxID=106004 RepID=A0A1Y2DGK4_9BASI|nr:hypothetical protein BCR35DRAFT_203871 [Leucosporidium creatinivorum]
MDEESDSDASSLSVHMEEEDSQDEAGQHPSEPTRAELDMPQHHPTVRATLTILDLRLPLGLLVISLALPRIHAFITTLRLRLQLRRPPPLARLANGNGMIRGMSRKVQASVRWPSRGGEERRRRRGNLVVVRGRSSLMNSRIVYLSSGGKQRRRANELAKRKVGRLA